MSVEASIRADEVTMTSPELSRPTRLLSCAVTLVAAALTIVVIAFAGSDPAIAQDAFTIEIDDVTLDSGTGEAVVNVRLVPGADAVAALSLTITPDNSLVAATASTSVGTTFACPLANGAVRFAGFDQPGWAEPVVLCEITLAGTGTTGSGTFSVEIKAATNVDLEPLTGVVAGGTIEIGGAEPTAEPSPTPTAAADPTDPEPSATPTPSPTRVPEVAVVPTATPEATATPVPAAEANDDEADADDDADSDASADDTDSSDSTSAGDGSPSDTDPIVELDPDTDDDAVNAEGAEESTDSGRGARSPEESPTATPVPVESPSEDTSSTGDPAASDDASADADDANADGGTDNDITEEPGDLELSGPLVDGSSTKRSGNGSSRTAVLAVAAFALLATGATLAAATRRTNHQ